MKALIVVGTIALAIVLVGAGALAGTVWAQDRWGNNMMGSGYDTMGGSGAMGYGAPGYGTMGSGYGATGTGMMGYGATGYGTTGPGMMGYGATGYGMMGPGMSGNWDWDDMPFGSPLDMPFGSSQDMPCGGAYTTPGGGEITSLEQAEAAVHDYVEHLGYTDLELTEIMEFEHNYYAIVAEKDTGIGALELLVDKTSGAVGPEPGPNMMWNAEYGMMGRGGGMMGGYATDDVALSPQEAQGVAQIWLDANLPGRTAGEPDPFYGYYTLHFLNDGQIEGMLSVHGSSGDVWYHSWHGEFVVMAEGHD